MGAGVFVIVETPAAALAKLEEYREDGFGEILVKDLDGKAVAIEELAKLAPLAEPKSSTATERMAAVSVGTARSLGKDA